MVFGINKKVRDGILPVLETKMTPEEQERLIQTWEKATPEQKEAYKKDASKLLKDINISKSSMRKIRRALLK